MSIYTMTCAKPILTVFQIQRDARQAICASAVTPHDVRGISRARTRADEFPPGTTSGLKRRTYSSSFADH